MAREPARWRDDPLGRPPAADALLRGARLRAVAPLERARLGARIETFCFAAGPTANAAPGAWRVGSGGVATFAALAALTASPLAPRVPAAHGAAPTVLAAGPSAAPAARAPTRAAMPVLSSATAPPLPPSAPSIRRARPAVDTLDRETRLVDGALQSLSTAPARALALLEHHRRVFPRGQLSAEREYLAVEALRRLDRLPAARRRAEALAAAFPGSSYAARARRAADAARDASD